LICAIVLLTPLKLAACRCDRLRGIKVSYGAIWKFVHAEGLSFKKTVLASEQERADIARRRRPPTPAVEEISETDRSTPAGVRKPFGTRFCTISSTKARRSTCNRVIQLNCRLI
jgi:hypothetical protein